MSVHCREVKNRFWANFTPKPWILPRVLKCLCLNWVWRVRRSLCGLWNIQIVVMRGCNHFFVATPFGYNHLFLVTLFHTVIYSNVAVLLDNPKKHIVAQKNSSQCDLDVLLVAQRTSHSLHTQFKHKRLSTLNLSLSLVIHNSNNHS